MSVGRKWGYRAFQGYCQRGDHPDVFPFRAGRERVDLWSRFTWDTSSMTGGSKKLGLSSLKIQASMRDVFRASTIRSERGIAYPFCPKYGSGIIV